MAWDTQLHEGRGLRPSHPGLSASRVPFTWLLPLCQLNSLGTVPVGEEAGDAQCLNPEPAQLPGSIFCLRSFQACPLTFPRQLRWVHHVIYSSLFC